MRSGPGHRAVVLLSALVLTALTALVRAGITHDLDRAVLGAIQGAANGVFDVIASLHTLVGLPYVTVPIAGAISLLLWRRGYRASSLAPLLLLATVVVELGLKLTTGHRGPDPELSHSLIRLLPSIDTPSSFPSGHAARLTFLSAFAAALVGRPRVTLAAAAFVTFTLVARVYIGDHWPTDVLGGAALGLAFALPAAAWVRSTTPSMQEPVKRTHAGGRPFR